MAKKAGRCTNYGVCTKADQRTPIDADEFNFVCPDCGGALRPFGAPQSRGPNWPLLGLFGLLLGGAIAGVVYLLRSEEGLPPPEPVPPIANNEDHTVPPPPVPGRCSPQPLPMEGKRTVYQRILTRPEALLASQPGEANGKPQWPLTRFYVYQRQKVGEKLWLLVGGSAECRTDGWIPEEQAVAWKQQITVAFDNPAGRERVLLFADDRVLEDLVRSPNPATELDPLLTAVKARQEDSRIVSAEPENYVDFTQRFYLLPIISFKEIRNLAGKPMNLLQVHSITKTGRASPAPIPAPTPPKAAVVFVIDSTISMGPYIQRTKEAVRKIFEQLRSSPMGGEIHFGLVAFRSSTESVPGLEYVTRLFVDPNAPNNAEAFLTGIDRVKEARVSSTRFDEDAYAGIVKALEAIDWAPQDAPYLARYVILITDAGALNPGDRDTKNRPLSATRKNAREIMALAKDHHVTLYALHLKTPSGKEHNNHARAASQYRDLTYNVLTGEPLYYAVENAGSIADFGASIDCAVRSMTHNIDAAGRTNRAGESAEMARACPPHPGNQALDDQMEKMRRHAQVLGRALRLEYLGRTPEGQGAPSDFEGWITDRDVKSPVRPNVEVKVLLSRNDLNNLANTVKVILEAAKSGQKSSAEFYNTLRSYIASLGRDPLQARRPESLTLAEMGLLGEYLDDLPYQSAVMSMSQDRWASLGPTEQDDFIRTVANKLERYEIYNSDNKLWQSLGPEDDEGEKVYPVPLDSLP